MNRLFNRYFLPLVVCVASAWLGANLSPSHADTTLSRSSESFSSSNLPIVVIETGGKVIPDEPKLDAHMGIIYNGPGARNHITDPFNHYDGAIGIELRGNASQMFPKKPYLIETRDENGGNNNVSLLGMPEENDWILRAAYIDRTLMRDAIAYQMSRSMGKWASRSRHVELVLNGEYRGVYILVESIKPDKNRVNIARMDSSDINGENVTGGYIYVIGQTENDFGHRRQLVYPKKKNVQPEQMAFIRKYDDEFRHVMEQDYYADPERGYPAWIDVGYFIDEILIQEATKNSDAYGWSSYFHKDRSDKLRAGPAWDFDQAMSNSSFNDGPNYAEWIIEKPEHDDHLRNSYPPFWIKLFREAKFKRQLALRWFELRESVWKTEQIMAIIDSTASYLDEAQKRNFEKWPILGQFLWRETAGYQSRDSYEKEVEYMKTFLRNRFNWMDSQLRPYTQESPDPVEGLVMYFDCDEMSGKVLQDKSGLFNDGVFHGNPRWVEGKYGGGLSFDGIDDYIDCGNPNNLDITDEITIAAWIKQSDAGNGEHNPWITKGDHSFALKHSSGNVYEFFIYDNGWNVVHAPVQEQHNNSWHHFAGTFDGNTLALYIDGNRVAEKSYSGVINHTADNINIARNAEASDRFWHGSIDEVRIYNIALTDEQIYAIYNTAAHTQNASSNNVGHFKLAQNYPNPFNGKSIIEYELPQSQQVSLILYDLMGHQVRTLINGFKESGHHSYTLSTDNLPSGIYFYRLQAGDGLYDMKKMMLIK